jgi:hypothetical protein
MSPALGYGAWSIVVGEANGLPGKEVIVATHRGLHVLLRLDMSIVRSNTNLPWEMSRPILALRDVTGDGYGDVILATDLGVLAVFDVGDLTTPLSTYSEPGVERMAVVGGSGTEVELALLSARGHVSRIKWNTSTDIVSVTAFSPRLNGLPVDMEYADVTGTTDKELVVLMSDTVDTHRESIWILDATTLQPIDFTFTNALEVTPPFNPSGGVALDLEVWKDGSTFVVLSGDRLLLVPFPEGRWATRGSCRRSNR